MFEIPTEREKNNWRKFVVTGKMWSAAASTVDLLPPKAKREFLVTEILRWSFAFESSSNATFWENCGIYEHGSLADVDVIISWPRCLVTASSLRPLWFVTTTRIIVERKRIYGTAHRTTKWHCHYATFIFRPECAHNSRPLELQ